MSAAILAAALAYARFGIAVFPVPTAVKKSFKSAEHSGGRPWGATNDPTKVCRDFTHWSGARIGIPTGAINNLIVVETDTVEGHSVDGAAALERLEGKFGVLPETRTAISPSGSIHRYFRHPGPGIKIRTTASELGAGIDIRGDGGCVIVPPSVNLDGRRYRWLNRGPIADMPPWLIALTTSEPRILNRQKIATVSMGKHGPGNPGASNAYGAAALESEIAALTGAAPGGRNAALNRASFNLHQLVGGGELDGGVVRNRLIGASTANGLVADDGLPSVIATIESGMRAGLKYPRSRRPR
jgi:hypothetical protein